MARFRALLVLCWIVLAGALAVGVSAQGMPTPQVNLKTDQLVTGGFVTVDSIYSESTGFVVIHRTSDGGVAGVSRPLAAGWTNNLRINIDPRKAEAQMSAMLHVDNNVVGTYEFGAVQGADGPVQVNGELVNPIFNAQVLDVTDQKLVNNEVTVRAVAVPVDSWVVIHADNGGTFGGVLGQTFVPAGTSTDVKVALSGDVTSSLWPMLHVDTGAAGVYEFGAVQGADGPVVVNGTVATFPIWTVNHIRVADQIAVRGDNLPGATEMAPPTPTITARSVLSDGPGILVIHANDNGNAGAILGAAFVPDGLSENVVVELDPTAGLTPVVWPMLHVDAGTVGVYDGLDVDGVAFAGDRPVTFTINAAPSLTVADQAFTEMDGQTYITVRLAVMDGPGWIAVHADDNGKPAGAVIGTALLHPGANWDVMIPLDPAQAGGRVWPMLHYDTNEMGVYEFGAVQGADAPTMVSGAPVVPAVNIIQ